MIESIRAGKTALFDVLPGVGKSREISKIAGSMPLTVLANLRENYGQFEEWGEDNGVNIERVPVAPDLCPVLQKDESAYPDDEEVQAASDADDNGWSPSLIHQAFDLPCQRDGDQCPYIERLHEIDTDGLDPLVGHYTQAYNPQYVEGRVVALDEDCFDAYRHEIKKPVEKAQRYIDTLDEFPFDEVRRPEAGEEEKKSAALEALQEAGLEPSDHDDSVGDFHAKAPLVAYAIYGAERMDNGLNVAELPGDRTMVFGNPHRNSLWLFDPPDFSGAEAVIALDATPCLSKWKRVLGDDPKHYRLFDDDRRNRYLRKEGYEFRQLHNHIWPVSNGGVSFPKCEAILREIYRKHGKRPDIVSSKKLIEGGENARGEYIEGLEDHGLDHLWRGDLHYSALRSKNDLGESELLVVLGSPGRKDIDYQFEASFLGECAIPATDEEGERLGGYQLDYQNEVANDILDTTRKGEVFQAAMRAGRQEGAEATVYIATGMVPDWLDVTRVGQRRSRGSFDACLSTRSPNEKAVIEVIRQEDGISGREVARRADLPKSTALDALNRLRDEGLVEKVGAGRGTKWEANGAEDVNIAGCVDLERMAEMSIKDSIRGSRPFSRPLASRRQPAQAGPVDRYPDWMRGALRWARKRRETEQEAEFYRRQSS